MPKDACIAALPNLSLSCDASTGGLVTAFLRAIGIPRFSAGPLDLGIGSMEDGRIVRGTDCAPVVDAAGTTDVGGLAGSEVEEGGRPGFG